MEKYIVSRVKEILENPIAVFEYQKNLSSTRKRVAKLEQQKKDKEKLLNNIPAKEKNLRIQHEHSYIDTPTLTKSIEEFEASREKLLVGIKELQNKIETDSLSIGYIESFKLFHKEYAEILNDVANNKNEIQIILKTIMDKVVVYSRPLKPNDVIAGRKVTNQQIPYKIDIQFKLPQSYLQELSLHNISNNGDIEFNAEVKEGEELNLDRLLHGDFGVKKPIW